MSGWLLYAGFVSLLLAAAAWLVELGSSARGRATRFSWAGALAAAVVVPLFGRPRAVAVEFASEVPVAPTPLSPVAGAGLPVVPVPWLDVAVLVGWSALSLLCLLAVVGTFVAVARARRNWVPERAGRHDILVSPAFGPALVGLTRPAIVLPRWARDLGLESSAIMAEHEHEHRRARDHVLLLAGGLAVALIPWNPVAWWMLRRLRGAVEMDCDRRTLASGVSLETYGRTLLEVSRHSPGRIWNLAPGLIEPRSQLERRLTMMGRGRRQWTKPTLVALAGGALVLVAVACETPAPTDLQDAYSRVANLRSDGDGPGYIVDGISSSGDTVFVMGRTLMYTGSDPLIFIDGRLLEPDQLSERKHLLAQMDPDDVERVEVLKGDAAARLGGPRAARGGAIFITLKEGVVVEGLDLTGPTVVELEVSSARSEAMAQSRQARERLREQEAALDEARARGVSEETPEGRQTLRELAHEYEAAANQYTRARTWEERLGEKADEMRFGRAQEEEARAMEEAAALQRLEQSGEASEAVLKERRARLFQEQQQAEETLIRLQKERSDRAGLPNVERARESAETSLRRAEALVAEAEALVSRAGAQAQPEAPSAEYLERLVRLQAAIRTQAEAARGDETRVHEALRRAGEMLRELGARLKERPGGSD